jgi:hypothetical protein
MGGAGCYLKKEFAVRIALALGWVGLGVDLMFTGVSVEAGLTMMIPTQCH